MKKRKQIIILAIILITLLILGVLFIRLRNGVRVSPTSEYGVSEEVVSYRQDDSEWEEDTLGESAYTMKTSGCLVSCIATAVSKGETIITPGELNATFTENNVYDAEGNIQWEKIENIEGYEVESFDEVSGDDIERCLSEGRYPIVLVRMYVVGNSHFVLIVGTEDGEYVCMDPLQDELTKLSDYGGYVYAVRCVWK